MQPTNWMISSVPSDFEESKLVNDVRGGYNRALLSWYTVDPLFTRQSSSLTPAHIKSDLNQLSNHYVREVYERELYPNKTQTSYNSAASLPVMNLAFYPTERGAYNLDPNLDYNGRLTNPKTRWGGMMRKLDTNDFETANIEYVEFWLLDPFIYTRDKGGDYGGDFYLNLGEVTFSTTERNSSKAECPSTETPTITRKRRGDACPTPPAWSMLSTTNPEHANDRTSD
jgi:cell surface protein SprA